MEHDFSGYATAYDTKCSDGLTIRQGAFKEQDGQTVPLVWQHMHNEPQNVLGFAKLEHRADGDYAYCSFKHRPRYRPRITAPSKFEHFPKSSGYLPIAGC